MKASLRLSAGTAALLAAFTVGAVIIESPRRELGAAVDFPSRSPSPRGFVPMTGNAPKTKLPPPSSIVWVRTDLKTLLGDALQTNRWDRLLAELSARMEKEPSAIVGSLIDENSLEEMRPVLLRMALEHCPADQAEAVANLLLARCKDSAEKTSALGALLEAVAHVDPGKALRLIPLAALTADQTTCLAGLSAALVDSLGEESIPLLAPYCAPMENGIALLAGAVARLAQADPGASLRGIDSLAKGTNASGPRSESILAAVPAILAAGHAREILDWLGRQSADSLTSEAWSELGLLLAASHPAEALKLSDALANLRDRASLKARIEAISTGKTPPVLEITALSADDDSREPVPAPLSEE